MSLPIKLLRRLAISLLIALLLVTVLLVLAPSLLKPSLNRWLPQWLGTAEQPASLHISKITWHDFKLDYLNLTLDDGSQLKLKNLYVRYRFAALLQGKISYVGIKAIQLELTDEAVEETAQEARQDAKELAHSHFNEYIEIPAFEQWLTLPIGKLKIDSIKIIHPELSTDLQASVAEGFWRLNGDVQVTEFERPWRLELQLQDTGRWFLLLIEDSETLLQQYGYVRQTSTHTNIEMQQKLFFDKFLPLLEDFPPLETLSMQGNFVLPNQGLLPAEVKGEMQIELTTQKGQLLSANDWAANQWKVNLTKEGSTQPWLFELTGTPVNLQLPPSWLEDITHEPLSLAAQQHIEGQCAADLENCQATLSLDQAVIQTQTQEQAAELNLAATMDWDVHQGITSVWTLIGVLEPKFAQHLTLPLGELTFDGRVDFQLSSQGDWQLTSTKGLLAQMKLLPIDGWQIEQSTVQLFPNLKLFGNIDAQELRQQLRANPIEMQLQPLSIHHPEDQITLNLATNAIICRPFISATSTSASCQVDINLNSSNYEQWPIPDTQLSGHVLWRDQPQQQSISTQLEFSVAKQQMHFRLNAQHDLLAQKGNMQWHLSETELNWNKLGLSKIGELSEFVLLGGSLSGQGWVDWQQQGDEWEVRPDTSLRIDNLAAAYSDVLTMENWNALLSLRRPFMGDYLLDAQVSGESLNPGVPLKNILARSQTRIDSNFAFALADIYEVRTDLLGGTVRTPLIHFDTREENNAFTVELDHIQLAQITALEPSSDVKATGTLDGIVPIIITPEGPMVPAGNMFARDPGGTVRYQNATSEALSKSNQNMGFAMQLLQDFRYDHLQTTMQYQPNGQFNLGLQFQGRNPDFFQGKPTHLNVNLDYNLLKLLESLRLADDLVGKLEEKYK